MKKAEIQVLAETIANMVFEKVSCKMQSNQQSVDQAEYVDSSEAAKILGLSRAYLMQVKDRYPHIKMGDTKQSQIRFRKADLLQEIYKHQTV